MFLYDKLFYFFGLCMALTIAIEEPNISDYYRISSVTDDSYLTGHGITKETTSEHESSDNVEAFQLWSVVQQVNGTNYFIVSAYDEFRDSVALVGEEGDGHGLWQRYNFEPVGRNLWTIYASGTKKCLKNYGIGKRIGLSLECRNTTSEIWILHNSRGAATADHSGVYYLQNPTNGKYITATYLMKEHTIENHVRDHPSKKQEWRFLKRPEYGDCYEIRVQTNRTQIIPTGYSSDEDFVERLTLVFELVSVGQARWKIKLLNSDHCLGFGYRESTGLTELLSSACEDSNKQIWFLIKLINPDHSKDGSRECETVIESGTGRKL